IGTMPWPVQASHTSSNEPGRHRQLHAACCFPARTVGAICSLPLAPCLHPDHALAVTWRVLTHHSYQARAFSSPGVAQARWVRAWETLQENTTVSPGVS